MNIRRFSIFVLFAAVIVFAGTANASQVSVERLREAVINRTSSASASTLTHASDIRTEARQLVMDAMAERFAQDQIIVQFKGKENFETIRVPAGRDVAALVSEFKNRNDVEYAEPDYIAYAFAVPNDPYYVYQWHFDNPTYGGVHAQAAWDITSGTGVIVAVIDTGVAYENFSDSRSYYLAPDLAGTSFVAGYDFVNGDNHPNDDEGHGTHVAGTVAQSTNNSLGVAGLAHGASIMPVKVLNSRGSGTYSAIANGIRFAADNGAKVINLSLGGSSKSSALEDALAYAYNKGVTIVAAAGNSNSSSPFYPAAYDSYVISVGATRFDEQRAPYSNYGPSLDIVAPGGDTSVDQNGDGYTDGVLQQTFSGTTNNFGYYFFQGTSMASPHVAAAAALVISNGTATTPNAVRATLEGTTDDLGAAGRDNTFGHGLLNVAAALGASVPPPPPLPPPPPPPPPSSTLFEDSFEGGLSNWTQDSQNDWFRSSQRKTDGTYSAEVDGSASNASLTSIPIGLGSATAATITFSWLIENSLDSGEYLAFDTSTDGGITWVERGRLRGNVDAENTWHNFSLNLSDITALKLRLRGTMSQSSEDANVDLVKVVAN